MTRLQVAKSLDICDVLSNIPSGNTIIFDITATIIPIEIHLIQSKIQLFIRNLEENMTPIALQKYVAIDETIIAKIIVWLSIIFNSKVKKNK
tara:strand:+ start:242 stop:517 length:276 start_codon:yes stop_codon:yes gene_type:complete